MKKYLQFFIPFVLIIALILWFTLKGVSAEEANMRWLIFGYFTLITLAFHIGFVYAVKSRPQVFVRYHMASSMFKLFMHLGIIVIYCVTHPYLAVRFIFTFMIMYFIFTIFEVILLNKSTRK